MITGYITTPEYITVQTSKADTVPPLSVSAAQINGQTGKPRGVVAINGVAYIGSPEEFPVFVQYQDGTCEIQRQATTRSLAYSKWAISGMALLVANGKPVATEQSSPYLRRLDTVERLVIGLTENGEVFIAHCVSTLENLKYMMCAYGVVDGMLIASDNIFVDNPRNKVHIGERPVVTLAVRGYRELPAPVVVIDPAYGGGTIGYNTDRLNEKDLTLAVAVYMHDYLVKHYQGTFMLTRDTDCHITRVAKTKMLRAVHADFMYECRCNAFDSITRGAEFLRYDGASPAVKDITDKLYSNIQSYLSKYGIKDNGLRPVNYKRLQEYPCPTFISKMLYMDNAQDAYLLEKPTMLRLLGEIQAEALAKTLDLLPVVTTPKNLLKPTTQPRYVVRVGTFKFRLGAEELRDRLRQAGFNATIDDLNDFVLK